jgi:hypothetical protein
LIKVMTDGLLLNVLPVMALSNYDADHRKRARRAERRRSAATMQSVARQRAIEVMSPARRSMSAR